MSAQGDKAAVTPLHNGDDGPVAENVPGYDAATLARVEDDEELFALELSGETDDDELDALDTLPDEPASARTLVDQPSKAPSRKVKAAGLGGLLAAVPVSLIAALDTITVSEQVATLITGALTLAGAVAAAYFARDKAPQV